MEDMETIEVHNGLYAKVNEVATNVALIKQQMEFLNEKVGKQNGRVDKSEVRIDDLEKTNSALLVEVKKLNINEVGREKSRKSVKFWFIDNTSAVAIALLIAYLMFRFGLR